MALAEFERDLPDEVRLAYLPQPGLIRLRLSAYCSPQAVADRVADVLRLLEVGVDGIITDRPVFLRDFLDARGLWTQPPAPDAVAASPRD